MHGKNPDIATQVRVGEGGISMAKKIIRGSVIGGFLGIVFGLALSYVIFFVKLYNNNKDTIAQTIKGSPYVSVMSTDDAENVSEEVLLRFHVRANSNSDDDIALKYDVRDAVLEYISSDMGEEYSREELMEYLGENIDEVQEIAEGVILEEGYTYPVDVYISNDYFPMRQYGEIVIPAGNYDAFRVDIGEAEGENFWCLLYPMMCYPIDGGAALSMQDGERLSEELGEEEYGRLFSDMDPEDNEVEIRFRLLDLIRDIN